MPIYRFHILLYKDIETQNLKKAKKLLDEECNENWLRTRNPSDSFMVEKGIEDFEPEIK